jgi:hypothetical protein
MSKILGRRRTIAFKEEATPGTAETSFTSADAPCKIFEATSTPDQDFQERESFSDSLGYDPDIPGVESLSLNFETELVGSGDVTVAPPFALLLKACAFAENALTRIPIGAITGGPIYVGETVEGGTSSAEATVAKTTYDGEGFLYVHSVTGTFNSSETISVATGGLNSASCSSTGAAVADIGFAYHPTTSDSSFPALTMRDYMDGKLAVGVGCRGNVTIQAETKESVRLAFSLQGKHGGESDVAQLTDSAPTRTPPVAQNTNLTSYVSGSAYVPSVASFEFTTGNEINLVRDMNDPTGAGFSYARIGQRQGSGSLDVLATTVGEHDWYGLKSTAATGAIDLRIGTVAGNAFLIQAPNAQYTNLNPAERERQAAYNLDLKLNRLRRNDELVILAI